MQYFKVCEPICSAPGRLFSECHPNHLSCLHLNRWHSVHRRPLLEGSGEPDSWDGEVGGPSPVPMAAGRYRLYYTGRPLGNSGGSGGGSSSSGCPWEGIGLAVHPKDAPEERHQSFEGLRTDFERLQ